MKTKILFFLLVICLSLLCLIACNGDDASQEGGGNIPEDPVPTNTEELIAMSNAVMDELESYEMNTKTVLECPSGEFRITYTSESQSYISQPKDDKMSFHSKNDVTLFSTDSTVLTKKFHLEESYFDGTFYYCNDRAKLCSPCSEEKLAEFLYGSDLSEALLDYKSDTFAVNENGYSLTLKEFSVEASKKLVNKMGLDYFICDTALSDIIIDLSFNKDLYLSGFDLDFVVKNDNQEALDESEFVTLELSSELKNYNNVKPIEHFDNASDYSYTDDVCSALLLSGYLNDYFSKESGKFKTSLTISTEELNSIASVSIESDWSFGVDEYGFCYNAISKSGTISSTLSYSNGKYVLDGKSIDRTELEAKLAVRSALSPFIYDTFTITKASLNEDGSLTVNLWIQKSDLGLDEGALDGSIPLYARFVVVDNEIRSIYYRFGITETELNGNIISRVEYRYEGHIQFE